jgi:hypothetical protein
MTPAPLPSATRPLWLGLILLTAAVIASAAGLLAYAGGANIPTAILMGGGAYAGATGLLLAVAHFAQGGR